MVEWLLDNAWQKLDDGKHYLAMGLAPLIGNVTGMLDNIVERGTWRGVRAATAAGEPPVLAFGLLVPRLGQPPDEQFLKPYEQFIGERLNARGAPRVHFEMDLEEAVVIPSLATLSTVLKAPTAYWYHHGDNGLVHEYGFGFAPGNPTAMMFYNEDEFKPGDHPPNLPRSAITACLWHLAVKSAANLPETSFPDQVRSFRELKT